MADVKKDTGKKVRPNDTVVFNWNGKDKFHKSGTSSLLHPVQAEKMKKKGLGDYKPDSLKKSTERGKSQEVTAGKVDENENV